MEGTNKMTQNKQTRERTAKMDMAVLKELSKDGKVDYWCLETGYVGRLVDVAEEVEQ